MIRYLPDIREDIFPHNDHDNHPSYYVEFPEEGGGVFEV